MNLKTNTSTERKNNGILYIHVQRKEEITSQFTVSLYSETKQSHTFSP